MSFFGDYPGVAWWLFTGLLALLGIAVSIIVKIKLGYMDIRDAHRERDIRDHEKRIAMLEGKKDVHENKIDHLTKELEQWRDEIRSSLKETRNEVKDIKGILRRTASIREMARDVT